MAVHARQGHHRRKRSEHRPAIMRGAVQQYRCASPERQGINGRAKLGVFEPEEDQWHD